MEKNRFGFACQASVIFLFLAGWLAVAICSMFIPSAHNYTHNEKFAFKRVLSGNVEHKQIFMALRMERPKHPADD
jgi:hypothetical protein